MTDIVDEWDDAPAAGDPGNGKLAGKKNKGKKRGKKKPPPLVFSNVEVFVTDYLAPTYRRKINGSTAVWCPEWWRHPEALQRITAMWRAWENLRHDPALGLSTWFLQHADPHMRVLLNPDNGPFNGCSPKDGHSLRPSLPLPVKPADPALWLSPAFSANSSATDTDDDS
ncbi:DUF4913 domain-containing protein (plasmid) [Streptomyces europaeiscabiei]|uniref:DUF4913 domain-containing protein n=1 Tax=Streptomyces europaeiscabiei TaxID=146819 RepID=UPI002E81638C|nr:DUF4913 domain-containing protein [Streptomyces europaeiscabiei]WUD38824.1 DUF4913 domain-containing protein [Streptomyces europaeiscabiei]